MECPFCGAEMQHGKLSGDGRGGVRFDQAGVKLSWSDKIAGVGAVRTKKGSGMNFWRFELEADYCPKCKKLILDAEVGR